MRYPHSFKTYHKVVSHANRGMNLEELINDANKYYKDNSVALISKKPTPIGIVSVKNENSKKIITKAFFKEQSTLDYVGVYKGYYIEFDAKETLSKTSFPLNNISTHQIDHIKGVINQKGISFLIIKINNEYYILDGNTLVSFINKEKRKSIPLEYIKKYGYLIHSKGLIKLDFISSLDNLIGGFHEKI